MSESNLIANAHDAFAEAMEEIQQKIEDQEILIEEQTLKIRDLQVGTIKSMAALFVLAYIYGAFFGVWMCPK